MRVFVSVLIWIFTAIVVFGGIGFLVLDAMDKVESITKRWPWIEKALAHRTALVALIMICSVLLIGDGYELFTKEMPQIAEPPHLSFFLKAPLVEKCSVPLTAGAHSPVAAHTAVPQTTINATNGIGISGGQVTNPTVNNYAPTDRHLDDAIATQLAPFAGDPLLSIKSVADSEAQTLAWELASALKLTPQQVSIAAWSGKQPKGLGVEIHDQSDSVVMKAGKLTGVLSHLDPNVGHHSNPNVPEGRIEIIVGGR